MMVDIWLLMVNGLLNGVSIVMGVPPKCLAYFMENPMKMDGCAPELAKLVQMTPRSTWRIIPLNNPG